MTRLEKNAILLAVLLVLISLPSTSASDSDSKASGPDSGDVSPRTNAESPNADCPLPYSLTIVEGNQLEYSTYGFSVRFVHRDVVKLDYRDGHFVLSDSLIHSPHPPPPPRQVDVDKRRRRYGGIPFVTSQLQGRDDQESWKAAVDAYREERRVLVKAVFDAYDEALPAGRDTAMAIALALAKTRPDIYEDAKVDPDSSGGLLVKRPHHEWHIIELGMDCWRHREVRPPERCTRQWAYSYVEHLRYMLERDTPEYPTRLSLAFGNESGHYGR